MLVLSGTAMAAEQPLAEVENLGDTLVFHPVTQFAELLLTVTGPCDFQYRQRVDEGEPFFRLDETTIDGAYTYDLVRIEEVDPGIVKILMQARKLNDEETPRALCRDGKLPGPAVSQSEGFQVSRGKIIYDPRSVEKALNGEDKEREDGGLLFTPASGDATALATKDFVINDDLIVDGSACIGFDCVNGEVFSFDTIRLKENNLRIKFDDTSVVPSFPANDWQLTANESANGGASKFSIEDVSGGRTPFTVEANARSHSLYVDDGGRIGSRTSTPSVEIHTIDGDTPTLRLQQDGSSGFEPQTWDVAGNETNFFIRDVTNGSTLPFRIRPGAPTSSIFVDVDADVGLGTSSPEQDLHVRDASTGANVLVEGTSASVILDDNDATADQQIGQLLSNNSSLRLRGLTDALGNSSALGLWIDLADGDVGINCNNSPDEDFIVGSGGSCTGTPRSFVNAGDGAWSTTSSRTYKENLGTVEVEGILEEIAEIDVYTYDFIEGPTDKLGLMAEDFHRVFGRGSDKVLNGQEVQMALWLAVQELTDRNQELRDRLAELEAKIGSSHE